MILHKRYTQVFSNKKFIKQYQKADIRIKSIVDQKLQLFKKNPFELGLRNHSLHGTWDGYRSIDITNDWRAIYKEIIEGEEFLAYFVALGTHNQLYN